MATPTPTLTPEPTSTTTSERTSSPPFSTDSNESPPVSQGTETSPPNTASSGPEEDQPTEDSTADHGVPPSTTGQDSNDIGTTDSAATPPENNTQPSPTASNLLEHEPPSNNENNKVEAEQELQFEIQPTTEIMQPAAVTSGAIIVDNQEELEDDRAVISQLNSDEFNSPPPPEQYPLNTPALPQTHTSLDVSQPVETLSSVSTDTGNALSYFMATGVIVSGLVILITLILIGGREVSTHD